MSRGQRPVIADVLGSQSFDHERTVASAATQKSKNLTNRTELDAACSDLVEVKKVYVADPCRWTHSEASQFSGVF
jgi:hypothetical protein